MWPGCRCGKCRSTWEGWLPGCEEVQREPSKDSALWRQLMVALVPSWRVLLQTGGGGGTWSDPVPVCPISVVSGAWDLSPHCPFPVPTYSHPSSLPENIARTVASLFSYSACGSCSLISSPLICSSSGAGLFTWPSDWSIGPSCTCSWRMVPRSWSGHSIPLLKTPQRPHDFPSKALAPLCGR